jgi:hypothetical protein
LEKVSDFCEHGNEFSGSVKGREYGNQLSHCQLLKKASAPCSLLFFFFVFSLSLIKHHIIKKYWGGGEVEVYVRALLAWQQLAAASP